jgi:hypothetical protein
MWWIYALLSAVFASLVAVFAKVGIKGVDSDLATSIRTVVILLIAWGIVIAKGATSQLPQLTRQNWIFLILSGCATGLSWLFYFRALQLGEIERGPRHPYVRSVPARKAYLAGRCGGGADHGWHFSFDIQVGVNTSKTIIPGICRGLLF